MRLIQNTDTKRAVDLEELASKKAVSLDLITTDISLYGFKELRNLFAELTSARVIVPSDKRDYHLLGGEADRCYRNQLQNHWLAKQFLQWLKKTARLREVVGSVPQSAMVFSDGAQNPVFGLIGAFSLTTDGLGITPGNPLVLVQATETEEEAAQLSAWFEQQWQMLPPMEVRNSALVCALEEVCADRAPYDIYALILHHLFKDREGSLDEEQVIKAATGIHQTKVWRKLYKFQKDAVVGAIDKLNRFGGCIIADSVGLGKTFEALAVIKYFELRNDRVLVLTPKRLRDNWILYRLNDRRNPLADDRFSYDVLNHTDLSRDRGMSGDLDLAHINWGNYDLVVIDESHNFRNKISHKDRESRYERLMRRIIWEGVKTRVLMLSATPVNNRLADLKNQIAFITEGRDDALQEHGVKSIDATTRQAQRQFNRWLDLPESKRTPARLIEMLGFDYFKLLDLLTIARSRKHIEKYYGIAETGEFPERLRPINLKPDVDIRGRFPPIEQINQEIRRLKLAAYAPLRYVLESKRAEYEARYGTQIQGGIFFRQADREENLVQLMRVNLLKRMESSVHAFALTLERQLAEVERLLKKIEDVETKEVEELDIHEVDTEDPTFESLLVGKKVKVLLQDVDRIRWAQDLHEDCDRLKALLDAARSVSPERDGKLQTLKATIASKIKRPINPNNRKVIVFSAFADTAQYLYDQLAQWAKLQHGIHTALITGTGGVQTTLSGIRRDMASILSAFAPRAKERPKELTAEGEIDLLIATDCISEGQNLQDCDWLINYDIHWNPVRIIQRFGRIDRIGSPNTRIQLVNFWPNMELDEYINLEARVSGRMVLLDISATGEENLIEAQSGDPMNDLEYRRKQLLKLQETVIDLEDLSSGISITDLTLSDFRMDLARYLKEKPEGLERLPLGAFAPTLANHSEIPPGILFCLRVAGDGAREVFEPGYPLAPYALVYVGEDGAIQLPYTQAKKSLDLLKRTCMGQGTPVSEAIRRWNGQTKSGADMRKAQKLLAKAVASIAGKSQERAIESLFTGGGTHALKGEFAGQEVVEVVAWLVILPEEAP